MSKSSFKVIRLLVSGTARVLSHEFVVYVLYIHIYMKIYTQIYVYVYVCIYMYMYIYTCMYIYIQIYTCIYTFTIVYVNSYVYSYINTYLYMYISMNHSTMTCMCVRVCVHVGGPTSTEGIKKIKRRLVVWKSASVL